MKKAIIFLIGVLLFTGCIEKYNLELEKIPPRLVVDGLITNERGPYYIRLTESHNGKIPLTEWLNGNTTPVRDALIIITDNVNQIDTLVLVDNIEYGSSLPHGNSLTYLWHYDDYTFRYYVLLPNSDLAIYDTVWASFDHPLFCTDRGFYKTQNLVGIPGRTYSLKIIYKNKEYTARDYMPPVPEIDSLGLMIIPGMPGQSDNYHTLLYFSEPQETKDYYLTQMSDEIMPRGGLGGLGSFDWRFSIFSDEFLQPYVNGLSIGSSMFNPMYVKLNSLSKEAYLYYKALFQQLETDGGAFKPAPASPPTNISNGALGFFRTSAVSEKSAYINGDNLKPFTFLTSEVTEITATTAVSGGELDRYYSFSSSGICWSTNPNPTKNDFAIHYIHYDKDASCKITNLTPNTKYYVRAFLKDYYGIFHYGTQVEFTTLAE